VEREAEARFARLSGWLERTGFAGPLVALSLRSSSDERRHAGFCAALAEGFGASVADLPPAAPAVLAPAGLPPRAKVLYEAVAACCVTETGSVGVLTSLLDVVRGGPLRRTLRALAADEVRHSRLGWAILAAERERETASLLGPWVPAMLAGAAEPRLFAPGAGDPDDEDEGLLELGVLPRAWRREVFVQTTREVVLPGLADGGIDVGPAERWLERQLGGP
jgi:hypothetical protein